MSNRSRLLHDKAVLNGTSRGHGQTPLLPPPVQPQQVQLTAEHLAQFVPTMLARGVKVQYGVQTFAEAEKPRLVFLAVCGPIQIPVGFSSEEGRAIAARILEACDTLDAPPAAAAVRDADGEGAIPA